LGPQAAKVADFSPIVTALRGRAPALEELWPLRITQLTEHAVHSAAVLARNVIADVKVSTSQTQIVAGSMFLHHVLPDLIPPIDRRYTFTFFTGQKMVPSDQAAFLEWFPILARIATECRPSITDAIRRGVHGHGRSQGHRQRDHGLRSEPASSEIAMAAHIST
jgi:hypothetical protein